MTVPYWAAITVGTTYLGSEDFKAFGRFYGQTIEATEGNRQGWSTFHNSVLYPFIKIAPIVFIGRKSRPGLSGKSMNSKFR